MEALTLAAKPPVTPTVFICSNSDVGMVDLPPPVEVEGGELDVTFEGVEAEEFPGYLSDGIRELMISSYEVPRWMYNAGLKFG